MDIREKFIHHIWDQRHVIPDLQTVSGKSLKIMYQGQYNTSNGPDFKNAVLNIGGEILKGDVEIHQKTYDWTAHQHQEDAAYNQTILHVVMMHKSNLDYTIKEDAGKVEILELKNQIDSDIAKLMQDYDLNPNMVQRGVCDYFTLVDNDELKALLKYNGWQRFLKKSNRFNAELHFSSFDQLLYSGFMEAMGYDKNKFNMACLAHQFAWATLAVWRKEGMNSTILAAIWLSYSGLMEKARKVLPSRYYRDLETAFEYQNFFTGKGKMNWNLFRVRPANHPVKRIIQASDIVCTLLDKGFIASLLHILQSADNSMSGRMREALNSLFSFSDPSSQKQEKLSKGLILSITGNIFLPIAYLYAEKMNDSTLTEKIRAVYYGLPAQVDNYITNFMRGYIDPVRYRAIKPEFIIQQGLINLYFMFCNYRLCDLCLASKQQTVRQM